MLCFFKGIFLFSSQGVNLRSACESGKVTYIDGLKLLAKALADEDDEDSLEESTADTDSGDNNPFANLRYIVNLKKLIGSLSSDVFERRMSTASEPFPLLTCLNSTKFVLLHVSVFALIETICLKIYS